MIWILGFVPRPKAPTSWWDDCASLSLTLWIRKRLFTHPPTVWQFEESNLFQVYSLVSDGDWILAWTRVPCFWGSIAFFPLWHFHTVFFPVLRQKHQDRWSEGCFSSHQEVRCLSHQIADGDSSLGGYHSEWSIHAVWSFRNMLEIDIWSCNWYYDNATSLWQWKSTIFAN